MSAQMNELIKAATALLSTLNEIAKVGLTMAKDAQRRGK